jgi:hypothetical protein
VAERVRARSSRRQTGPGRPAKKKRMTRLGFLGLAALAALILGFLAKRTMIPSAIRYIAYRAPEHPQAEPSEGTEQLTPADREQLDAIIKRKSK